ncbi:hypothetical protein, partial [Tardiphaga sp.]|uniref:hypothetical protein n=1 Tax=Tardiphaga sp. TaxID=1926292 RepID=UPI0026240ADD
RHLASRFTGMSRVYSGLKSLPAVAFSVWSTPSGTHFLRDLKRPDPNCDSTKRCATAFFVRTDRALRRAMLNHTHSHLEGVSLPSGIVPINMGRQPGGTNDV